MANETEPFSVHEVVDEGYNAQGDRIVITSHFGGSYSNLLNEILPLRVGTEFSGEFPEGNLPEDVEGVVCTGVTFDRKAGSLGHASHTITYVLKREIWNVEWQEISKDIRTWISSANCPNPVTGATAAKQLAYLAAWQSLKDVQDWENYAAYKYPIVDTSGNGSTTTYTDLPEPVATVAHKIMKGVESYSIFAPVVTRTTTHAFYPPASGNLGKIQTPMSEEGWTSFNGQRLDFSDMANQWLKNVERSSSNGDGTFTLVEGWLGADEVDGDLYQSASTGGNG